MQFNELPCKTEHLDSSTPIPVFNSCQHYVLLGIAGSTVTWAFWLWSCTWECSSFSLINCDQNQCMQLAVCTAVSFFCWAFFCFETVIPPDILWSISLIHLLESCLLILQFGTGQLHFWIWVKIHMPHWLILILVWDSFGLRSCVFQKEKNQHHRCLVYSVEAWNVQLLVKWLFNSCNDFKDNYLGFTMK